MTAKKACALAVVTSVVGGVFLAHGWAAPKNDRKNPAPDATPAAADNPDVAVPTAGPNAVLGTYTGQFGTHRMTICLQNIVGETVNGYSVVAGNERAFSGSLTTADANGFGIVAREPGDHPQDGRFDLNFLLADKHLTGTWTPNNQKIQSYTFDLTRRNFKYDPKLGQHAQASTRPLKTADVENLRPEELRIMRNEIYARHGYTFRLKDMRDYFDTQDWYMPISFNVSTQLTPVEQRNEALIKKYENYGSDHYDAFGR